MTHVQIPLPPELDQNPELAVLATLDAALKASVFALVAAHPPLRDPKCQPGDSTPDSYWIAAVFLSLADQLAEAIAAYRRTVDRERDLAAQQGFPF